MRIECLHGYFRFEEFEPGEISRFMSLYGLEVESAGDHFTFSDLVEAPDYSLPAGTFLATPTTVAFEGRPWEVMRENGLVYNFLTGLVVPILTIVQPIKLIAAGNYFVSPGMILPGSITDDGLRVTDYSAHFDGRTFRYSEVDGE